MEREDAWVEVRIGALKHNLRAVKSKLAPNVRLMAVVKANAYGHGLVRTSEAFVAAGADALGVSRLSEALELRAAHIGAPILCMAPCQPRDADEAVQNDIEVAVDHEDQIEALRQASMVLGRHARVHLKVDTGMGRLGIPPSQAGAFAERIHDAGLDLAGFFTHLANAADKSLAASQRQLAAFAQARSQVVAHGREPFAHACNSAGMLRLPEAHFAMVRVGTLLYGQSPIPDLAKDLDLRPTWMLKARVVSVRDLPKGADIGYGSEFRTKEATRVAVVAIGTSDGFTLAPEGPAFRQSALRFWLKKKRRSLALKRGTASLPVLGRVSMNLTCVDCQDAPDIQIGDAVEVPCLRLAANALLPRLYVD